MKPQESKGKLTRAMCDEMDRDDPLAPLREKFDIPDGVINLDGNSLGSPPKATAPQLARVVGDQWPRGLITNWFQSGWLDLPGTVGDKIAGLIGADAGEVIAGDSTSVNLFKLAASALMARPGRPKIVTSDDNFPTDLYILEGLSGLMGEKVELIAVPAEDVMSQIDKRTALVTLTHVQYRTAEIWDMAAVNKCAQDAGALTLWDLSHSAGAIPVDLNSTGSDLAVGCGYKYLNGGPGAPAYLFVARRHHDRLVSPLSGWMGHEKPFDFARRYRPGSGIERFRCGTPSVLGLTALDSGLDIWMQADITSVREKSLKLGDLFIELTRDIDDIELITPLDHHRRGSQVAFAHPEAEAIMARLVARGIIGDFRPPDALRFGFTPLYTRYVDVFDAAQVVREAVAEQQAA